MQRVRTANIHKIGFDPVREIAVGQPVPVTQGSRVAVAVNLSPDGHWLVFETRDKQEDIFVVGTDGSGLRQLTDDIYRDRQPRWSPDGKRIAFHSNRSGKFEIWAMNADGSGLEQLTDDRRGIVIVPVWSPDGTRLAYTMQGRNPSIIPAGKPWNEKAVQSLPASSDPSLWFWLQDWSRDGKKLSGHQQRPDGTSAGIAVYSFDSQKFERLTDFGRFPLWLSDNRRMLFQNAGKLYLLDSRSRKVHEVISAAPNEVGRCAVSSDDRWLYFALDVTEADIWLMGSE